MSAQVIRLWGGRWEQFIRVPDGPLSINGIRFTATIIILPVIDTGRPLRKRRVRVTQVSSKPAC